MAKRVYIFGILISFLFSNCNSNSESAFNETISKNETFNSEFVSSKSFSVLGKWMLLNYSKKDGSVTELQFCDRDLVWNFTNEEVSHISDGKKMYKLKAIASEKCKNFQFESNWTMQDGDVFISSTQIGGEGGVYHSGIFRISNFSEKKFEAVIDGDILVFMRI